MAMTDYSERIPAAIANAERMLDASEYLLIPPHIGGNETKLTLVLTAGEAAMAKALWALCARTAGTKGYVWDEVKDALIVFTEKIEQVEQ